MLCEYLQVPYQNAFFNPYTWKIYKNKFSQDWLFEELPFIVDSGRVVTQAYPMCEYIIRKTGHLELLGKTWEDQLVVDRFTWSKDLIQNVLSLVVENKNNASKLMAELHEQWDKHIKRQLL